METFVNKAIHNGIINYLNYTNNLPINKIHLFEFWVIRVLSRICEEINIINPYKLGKEDIFKNNLLLFGMNNKEVALFIKYMDEYNSWLNSPNNNTKTNIPNKICEILINMILMKSEEREISSEDLELFNSFFFPTDAELLKIKSLIIKDTNRIPKLWNRKKAQFTKKIFLEIIPPKLLPASDYSRYGLLINEVKQLSNLKIKEINDKIKNEDAANSEGGRTKIDPYKLILTSGSGFVDTVVLLSIMATEIMIGLLIAFWFLRR